MNSNTELLIERFERERQDAELLAQAERKQQGAIIEAPRPAPRVPSTAELADAELQARSNLAFRFPGVNLDMPGFKGLVRLETERILREGEA